MERNKLEEMDGLFWESETHEWFRDRLNTQKLHKNSVGGGGVSLDDELPNMFCFNVRDKKTGIYERVVIDGVTQEVVLVAEGYMKMAFEIDKWKISRRFDLGEFDEIEEEDLKEELITKWKNTGKTASKILEEYRGQIASRKFGF
jgi:hypothetical protein